MRFRIPLPLGGLQLRARIAKSKMVEETVERREKNDGSRDFSRKDENEENCVVLRD